MYDLIISIICMLIEVVMFCNLIILNDLYFCRFLRFMCFMMLFGVGFMLVVIVVD